MPRVSVVVPTYNAAAFVSATVEALVRQTYRDLEIVVVDDASSDKTIDRVEAVRDDRIRIIRNRTNQGVARSRNIGITAATGEYLFANDHDDVSLATRLERQVAFLDEHAEVLMVGAGTYTLRNRVRFADPLPPTSHAVIRWCLMTHNPVCHSTMSARLERLRREGLEYDPQCDLGDDFDLYHRMAAVGRLAALPERLVMYRLHGNNASIRQESDMSARGGAMLTRAHARYLGFELDPQLFDALWRVVTIFQPARSLTELSAVGDALGALLERYLQVSALSLQEIHDVQRVASRQWWDIINRSVPNLGRIALAQFETNERLRAYRPTPAARIRRRLGRFTRTVLPRLVR
jgi:glycosyltransferase involved in cell wall biosynthesis